MAAVKKRKPTYEAFQWGTDTLDTINNCLAQYSGARIEEGWWGGDGGFLSVWDMKKGSYVDHRIGNGDWVVIRSDGRVRVMESETFRTKFEETK